MGGSAGGALALQTANQVVKDASLKPSLKGVVALVPCVAHPDSIPDKYKSKYKAYEENATGVPIIDKKSMDTFFQYVVNRPKHDARTLTSDLQARWGGSKRP